jgi:GDP-4-dehydro-6-deoxy-D-mannose reductase
MEKNRTAVTGINGFVGHHLAKELHDKNTDVVGIGTDAELTEKNKQNVVNYIKSDLTQEWPELEKVDSVIHLAGLAAVGPSFDNPQLYINANSSMVTNMCEYYLRQEYKPRIILVSSGTVYDSNQPMPLSEDSPVSFNSPYSVSKVLNENQAEYYRKRGLDIIVARPFNHIGPGQMKGFLLPDLTESLMNSDDIIVGNLATKRDYTDVRDVVRAYRLLSITKKLGAATYNICSGKSIQGYEILDEIKSKLNKTHVNVSVDESKIRPTDPQDIYGDSSKLRADTGWEPVYNIKDTISDFIDNINE